MNSADGTEIYFKTPDGKMMATPITDLGSELTAAAPVGLFSAWIGAPTFNHQYDVTTDGHSMISVQNVDENPPPIRLIQSSNVF